MVNKAALLCGLVLVLLVVICYLFTSVDLGELQKNVNQWTKNKISFIHHGTLEENKDMNLFSSGFNKTANTIPTNSSIVKTVMAISNYSETVSIAAVHVTQLYYNDTSEMLNGIRVYDWSKPVTINPSCIPMKNLPKTTMICLFDPAEDVVFSNSIITSGLWDAPLVREFRYLLGRQSDLNLIDVGSNLGLYSLIAATLGHNAVCVEPFPKVYQYFHKSVIINNFQHRITLLANAISDKNEFVKMSYSDSDMTSAIATTANESDITIENIASENVISAITWKDLANFVPFKRIVLKYDISLMNHNNNLITEAKDLFSTLDVQYVFMHWGDSILDAANIIAFFRSLSYIPKKRVFGSPIRIDMFNKWRGDIIWEKGDK